MDDAIARLRRDHHELLVRLDDASARLAEVTMPLLELARFLAVEVEDHFALEEEALFPVLARGHDEIGADTLALLRDEHGAARRLYAELDAALRHGSVARQVGAAEAVIDHLRAHVAKEDTMVLAVADATLDDAERAELAYRARARGAAR